MRVLLNKWNSLRETEHFCVSMTQVKEKAMDEWMDIQMETERQAHRYDCMEYTIQITVCKVITQFSQTSTHYLDTKWHLLCPIYVLSSIYCSTAICRFGNGNWCTKVDATSRSVRMELSKQENATVCTAVYSNCVCIVHYNYFGASSIITDTHTEQPFFN